MILEFVEVPTVEPRLDASAALPGSMLLPNAGPSLRRPG